MDSVPRSKLFSAHGALSSAARLDVAPAIAAYERAGLIAPTPSKVSKKNKGGVAAATVDALRAALQVLPTIVRPQVVGWPRMMEALTAIARSLATTAALPSGKEEHLMFMTPPGPKSNLWIFLMLMHLVRDATGAPRWPAFRDRVVLAVLSEDAAVATTEDGAARRRKYHLVLCDDCVYSGEQMSRLMRQLTNTPWGGAVARVTFSPAFTTVPGLAAVSSAVPASMPPMAVAVPGGVLGYPTGALSEAAMNDAAICVRTGAGWMVTSIFESMGVAWYRPYPCQRRRCRLPHGDETVFSGEELTVHAGLQGQMAAVFEHKVADGLSLPFQWLAEGRTLGRLLLDACRDAPCDLSRPTDVLIAKLSDVFEEIDRGLAQQRKLASESVVEKKGEKNNCGSADNDKSTTPGEGLLSYGRGILVASQGVLDVARLLRRRPNTSRVAKGIVLSGVPMFLPLIQPADACGKELAAARDAAARSGGERAFWLASATDGVLDRSRCVDAPYKRVLPKSPYSPGH